MSSLKKAKKRAAIASIKLIKNGQIVGLGTGSTAEYMIEELGRKIRQEDLQVLGVPTSNRTAKLAVKHGIPLTSLNKYPRLDIAIDGADQVDPELNLIKGMGGALTREKIVDGAAETLAVIVDDSKIAPQLGIDQVVPVEVISFAVAPVMRELKNLGGEPIIRLSKEGYFITDNGNNIIDVDFGLINDVKKLEKEIKMIRGVVESGLFVNMATFVFIGNEKGVEIEKRRE